MTVAILFERFGPYHRARLEAAGRTIEQSVVGVELRAVEGRRESRDDAPMNFRTPVVRLTGSRSKSLHAILDELTPGAVAVPGWRSTGALSALSWCVSRNVPAILMSDSIEIARKRFGAVEAVKRRLVACFGAALVAGERSGAYAAKLGVSPDRIFHGYDVVDNEHFYEGASGARAAPEEARKRYQLPGRYFLCVSRFIPEKNLPRLLSAYARYLRASGEGAWALVLVGDGPERPGLEECIRSLAIGDHVYLAGAKQYKELPAFYALAGALVLPSVSETWGLVVNEAMACGLPVLVSDRCGCVPDLIQVGANGFAFDPYDVAVLADLLSQISGDACNRAAMGLVSQQIIRHWTLQKFAKSLSLAIDTARAAPRRRRRSDHVIACTVGRAFDVSHRGPRLPEMQ